MAKRLMELMQTTSEPEMIESEIYGTVIEAVKKNLVGTNLLALRIGASAIPGGSIDIVTQDKDSMIAHKIAEGAEIPINNEAVSYFTLTPEKYGLRPLVTKEMIEDNKWDIIQRQLQEAGYTMQKQLDSLIMAQIKAGADANSTAHAVNGGSALTFSNIPEAILKLEEDDHKATDMVIHPEVANDIRNIAEFVHADKSGVTNVSQSLIGTLFDMKVWVSTNGTSDSSYKYAYVVDRNHALCLAEKRPITVERYNDVTRDLSGIAITARWAARYLRPEACAYIYTT